MKSWSPDDKSYVLFISVFWELTQNVVIQCVLYNACLIGFFPAVVIWLYILIVIGVILVTVKPNVKEWTPLPLMIMHANKYDSVSSMFTIILSLYNRFLHCRVKVKLSCIFQTTKMFWWMLHCLVDATLLWGRRSMHFHI